MSTKPTLSIDARLLAAQVAIDNALANPDILAALEIFNHGVTKLTVGRTLYEEVLPLVNQQKLEYGEQYEATETVKALWAEADAAYMRTLKVARVALRDNVKAQAAMMLTGPRKRTLSGWIEQVEAFYGNLLANADLLAAMAFFGYNQTKLEAEAALLQAVRAANLIQEKEKGEAQEATKLRDAKMDELDAWMADFKAIAQVALEEHPQWLEILGFGPVP